MKNFHNLLAFIPISFGLVTSFDRGFFHIYALEYFKFLQALLDIFLLVFLKKTLNYFILSILTVTFLLQFTFHRVTVVLVLEFHKIFIFHWLLLVHDQFH